MAQLLFLYKELFSILIKAIVWWLQNKTDKFFGKIPRKLIIDDLIDHIMLVEKVQKGLDDVANDKVKIKSEAQKKLSKWLK